EDPGQRRAIDPRRLGQFARDGEEILAHEERAESATEKGRQVQGRLRAVKAEETEDDELRDDRDLPGHHQRHQKDDEDRVAERETDHREDEPGHRTGQKLAESRDRRDEETVPELAMDRDYLEQTRIVLDRKSVV